MRKLIFALVLVLLLAFPALAWEGKILSVHDGDTVRALNVETGKTVTIRLYGIDAPEFPGRSQDGRRWDAQAYCKKSRDFLRAMLPIGSRVTIIDMGLDKYTRTVGAVVSLPDGRVVQEELLRAGLVWVYPQYCKDCRQWKALQEKAQQDKKGLWRSKDPVPPWEWRKQ